MMALLSAVCPRTKCRPDAFDELFGVRSDWRIVRTVPKARLRRSPLVISRHAPHGDVLWMLCTRFDVADDFTVPRGR